jgi:serine/threonine protein kinase
MSVNLEQHGWKGCEIPLSLEDVDQHLPTWRDLQVLRPPETYGKRILRIPYVPVSSNILPAFQMGEQIDQGTYGQIIKAHRALYQIVDPSPPTQIQRIENFAEIVCKVNEIDEEYFEGSTDAEKEAWYAEEVQAILHEASLHALAYHILASHNFPHVIPQLYEVYATSAGGHRHIDTASDVHSVVIGMEFVRGETLHKYFADHFLASTKPRIVTSNDRLLMDILIQLAIYLEILQTDLRFNHRDLKINNVLRRHHTTVWYKSMEHPALSRPWVAYQDLVIIDFGFSCVACDDSRKSLVQAGSWFKPSHDCLKGGRDLALFLYCLQCYYPLEERISPALLECLHTACTIPYGTGELCLLKTDLDKYGVPRAGSMQFGDGIYKLLRREEVDVTGCAPRNLLAALDKLR